MSTVVQPIVTDAQPTHLQPRTAAKPKKSNKAPAVKAAVLVSRANGTDKRKIARELGIARQTVESIISEANLDQQLASGRITCATLIPEAVSAIGVSLKKGDGELGRKFLNDMGVIGRDSQGKPPLEAVHLSQAINIMFKAKEVEISGTLHQNSAQPSTNPPQKNTEVIDTTIVK